MFKIETKNLKISEELNRKIDMICRFACVKYEFIPGNIKSVKNTNIAYVKPHILKVKGNDYYTPFIKSKLENHTKDYINELKELDKQMDRIKTAYIKGVMKLEDFDKEIKHIDYRKLELEKMIKEQKQYESLSFTVDDLIIFEDKQKIDLMTNPSNYLNLMTNWFMLSRKEKQKIISRYIDNIELERNGDNYIFKNIDILNSYLSDEIKYHKECKTPLSLALFTDDKGNHIVMNSEERTLDKAKKYFEKLKNYMSDYTDCELNYYEIYYDGEKNDGCFNAEETEEIIRLILLKDTKGAKKVRKLGEVLANGLYDFNMECIKNVQNINSKESKLLQLADILIGAISYLNRNENEKENYSKSKMNLIETIINSSGYNLRKSTFLSEEKFNLFLMELQ